MSYEPKANSSQLAAHSPELLAHGSKTLSLLPGTRHIAAMSLGNMPMPITGALMLSYLVSIGGCRGAGRFLGDLFRERPPIPLDSMSVASDGRIDLLGYLVGSFVGEGTSRSVHLLSSDTGLVAGLLRRYRPDLVHSGDVWGSLSRAKLVTFAPAGRRRTVAGIPRIGRALVGSPVGHMGVTPGAILLHGSSCGWRGAQVEIVADPHNNGGFLRGPVLASFTKSETFDSAQTVAEFRPREAVPAPGGALTDELIGRTARVMDSVLALNFKITGTRNTSGSQAGDQYARRRRCRGCHALPHWIRVRALRRLPSGSANYRSC